MTREVARRMADAAGALLASLDPPQGALCAFPFPSDEERQTWFYTPTDHGGVTLAQLTPVQQRLAMILVRAGTSRGGYVTVSTIMGLENVLDELEGFTASWGQPRGRDPSRYYLRVFGEPGSDRWAWRFGGHHVSINHLVIAGEVAATTPFFLGADPARAPLLGPHLLRPLSGAEDLARDLVRSLDEDQMAAARLTVVAPADLAGANRAQLSEGDQPLDLEEIWRERLAEPHLSVLRAGQAAIDASLGRTSESGQAVRVTLEPRGLAASRLDDRQRDQLRALLDVYLGRIPEELADREAAKFAGPLLDAVHLAWAGSTEPGRPHYYRLQGPRLWCEYDNAQRDGNHVHTVWRDPIGDFGVDVLAEHRRASHRSGGHGHDHG